MNVVDEGRRSFLFTVGALAVRDVLPDGAADALQIAAPKAYVLGASAGEQLLHFRDRGRIVIKAGSATGSETLACGTQQVMKGTGIPIHRHFQMDEAFFVLEGAGVVILNDERRAFEKGATIFIPDLRGMASKTPTMNCSLCGRCRRQVLMDSSATRAVRPA